MKRRIVVILPLQSNRRKGLLPETADRYERLPARLRNFVAAEAGVVDCRLDKIPPEDRVALYAMVKKLSKKLTVFHRFLLSAQTLK